MTTPYTLLRSVLSQMAKTLVVIATDGGANDGKGVEVTGTSDGAVNVNLTGSSGSIGTVNQGTKTADATNAWPVRLYNAAGALLGVQAAAASLPVTLSTENVALYPASLGTKAATSSFAVTLSTENSASLTAGATAAKQDTGNTSLGSIDGKLVTTAIGLNPTSVARGSQAATGSAVALGGSTTYTAGIFIWNSDTANYVTIGTGTPTDGAGTDKVVLGPGQGYTEPTGNLANLKIIAATGSPVVNWIGMTK